MKIYLSEALCKAVGRPALEPYGINFDSFKWQKEDEIELSLFGVDKCKALVDLLFPHAKIRMTPTIIADIGTWIKALEKPNQVRLRKVEQFQTVLENVLVSGPRQYLYEKDLNRGTWVAYYVEQTHFHPKHVDREGRVVPDHLEIDLYWLEFGGRHDLRVTFWAEDCVNLSVDEALGRKNMALETPELWEMYNKNLTTFNGLVDQIGKQMWATGKGSDDVDSWEEKERKYSGPDFIALDRDGRPARVVVDIFYENEKSGRDRDNHMSTYHWQSIRRRVSNLQETLKDRKTEEDEDHSDDAYHQNRRHQNAAEDYEYEDTPIVVPLHPNLAVFDLQRHIRVRLHVDQLTEYVYNPQLGEKLILPDVQHKLVSILLAHKGQFKDIVAGKGGGAIVLCAGKPGVGKTLTAEVYSEVAQRPLYNVQCSQLGTSPKHLESALYRTFLRATRWNAILLLDEADVYVTKRGTDLEQNAIVGVFLRVLEYFNGVMFMTTNRAELVDDAITSRCLARMEYSTPSASARTQIWRILAEVMGLKLSDETIEELVDSYPRQSGRDIKNLLKLAALYLPNLDTPISAEIIDFVHQFKPTVDVEDIET